MPLFSIIIPTYNRASLLSNTIHSCLNQTYQDFEIIIVDDGSTDNTEEIVASFDSNKIRSFKIPNSERGLARNYGADKAQGQWLYFMDSDDILYSHHLQTARDIIYQNNTLCIFHLAYEILENQKKTLVKNLSPDYLIYGNPYSCHGMFIHKNLFHQYRFNEDRTIAGLEDWELWLRISAHYTIPHFPIVTSALIQHSNRSVMQVDKDKWIKKIETFIHYVTSNDDILKKYKHKMALFYCGTYTYLALHLSFNPQYKKEAFHYWLKGLRHYPLSLFYRRSGAILKRILFFR